MPAAGHARPNSAALGATPWGDLPPRMRVLHVTARDHSGAWLAEAFAADSASQVQLRQAAGLAAALEHLRDEVFDALFIDHEPGSPDALDFVEGLRAGGSEEPIFILGTADDQDLTTLAYEVGADAYVATFSTTVRAMLYVTARAIERRQLIRECRRLSGTQQHRLQQEHAEADHLLTEQRLALAADPSAAELPPALAAHYRELLRSQVMMGSGTLSEDLQAVAHVLSAAGVTARQTMRMHLEVVEDLVRGLGSRSARHVMNRAQLLGLELLVHLAEGYRLRVAA